MARKQRISYLPLEAMDDEMAPGFGTAQELGDSKASPDYLSRKTATVET